MDKGDSVYIQFDAVDGKCRLSYKRWSKLEFDKSAKGVIKGQELRREAGPLAYKNAEPEEGYHPVKRIGRDDGVLKIHQIDKFDLRIN